LTCNFRPQFRVVDRLALRTHQAQLGRRNLVQHALRERAVAPGLIGAQVGHALVGGGLDHVGIALEPLDPQQPVMIGRLLLGRNAQPLVVRVERLRHAPLLLKEQKDGSRKARVRILDRSGGHA
jgi:hypothetical protein